MILPHWSAAPTWAHWLAQNYEGRFYWFEDKPRNLGPDWPVWACDFRRELAGQGMVNPDWEKAIWNRP